MANVFVPIRPSNEDTTLRAVTILKVEVWLASATTVSAQWVPGLKNKRPERTPQKVINDRYVLIFALYCQLTHWKTSCRTCTSGKYFPMAPYRHRGSAEIQSFHLAFAGSKVKVWFYMVYLSENWMLSKPSEGMAYLHGLLSTSTHLVADLAFKTSQENRSRGKL